MKFSLIFILFSAGCAQIAWKKYQIKVPPDYSCMTGSASGYTIYKWNCLNNEHIVIHQVSSEMSRGKAVMEKTTCGEETKFEKRIAKDPKHNKCKDAAV